MPVFTGMTEKPNDFLNELWDRTLARQNYCLSFDPLTSVSMRPELPTPATMRNMPM
jgi:hypothetical protein